VRNSSSSRPSRAGGGSRNVAGRPARSSDSAASKWWEPGGSTAPRRGERSDRPSFDGDRGRSAAPRRESNDSRPRRDVGSPPGSDRREGGFERPRREGGFDRDRNAGSRGSAGRRDARPSSGGRFERTEDRRLSRSGDSAPRRNRREEEDYELTRGSRPTRGAEIAIPSDADPKLLDPSVRAELRSLSKLAAEFVGAHLVAAGQLIDDNPTRALEHARAARGRGARVGAVREACGLAAYHAGEWAEALSELRAARRISGDASNIAVMADCERALGRPERALKSLDDPVVGKLDPATRAELLIVVAGARRDLGQIDAALSVLERGGLDTKRPKPGSARLWYAYADALEAAGRTQDAIQWFGAAASVDHEDETDAADRAANLL
jgi:hypothetical protein